jgi:hypothetical protein
MVMFRCKGGVSKAVIRVGLGLVAFGLAGLPTAVGASEPGIQGQGTCPDSTDWSCRSDLRSHQDPAAYPNSPMSPRPDPSSRPRQDPRPYPRSDATPGLSPAPAPRLTPDHYPDQRPGRYPDQYSGRDTDRDTDRELEQYPDRYPDGYPDQYPGRYRDRYPDPALDPDLRPRPRRRPWLKPHSDLRPHQRSPDITNEKPAPPPPPPPPPPEPPPASMAPPIPPVQPRSPGASALRPLTTRAPAPPPSSSLPDSLASRHTSGPVGSVDPAIVDPIKPLPDTRPPVITMEPISSSASSHPWLFGAMLTVAGIGGTVVVRARRAHSFPFMGSRQGGRHRSGRRT